METATLAALKPGNIYLGRDGETEYLITNKTEHGGSTLVVANLKTGELRNVCSTTEISATQNHRLRVV